MSGLSSALLAGGQSRRMGRDKCLIEFGGIPLWRRQFTLLSGLSEEVAIVASARPPWCPPDARWLADRIPGCGPLGGLDVALASASQPRLLLLAVDLPTMSARYLRSLIAQSTDMCGVIPLIDDLFQPLVAIYPRAVGPVVSRHLTEPDKSLQRLVRSLVADGSMQSVQVASGDLPLFRNLNTPND